MSKLSTKILAHQLPDRHIKIPKLSLVDVTSSLLRDTVIPYSYKYSFSATLGTSIIITEELISDKPAMDYCLAKVRKSVEEEVFGEFKQPLRDLQLKLLRNGQYEEARDVDKIFEQMFST